MVSRGKTDSLFTTIQSAGTVPSEDTTTTPFQMKPPVFVRRWLIRVEPEKGGNDLSGPTLSSETPSVEEKRDDSPTP